MGHWALGIGHWALKEDKGDKGDKVAIPALITFPKIFGTYE
jgi:hypothetical protein